LALGAPGADGVTATQAGRVYVVPVPASQVTATSDPRATTIFGAKTGAGLGKAMAAADFDGDGNVDLALGSALEGGGVVYLVDGQRLASTSIDLAKGEYDAQILGPVASGFGSAITIADLDGAAPLDLVVGAPAIGSVYLFAGGHARPSHANVAAG